MSKEELPDIGETVQRQPEPAVKPAETGHVVVDVNALVRAQVARLNATSKGMKGWGEGGWVPSGS